MATVKIPMCVDRTRGFKFYKSNIYIIYGGASNMIQVFDTLIVKTMSHMIFQVVK